MYYGSTRRVRGGFTKNLTKKAGCGQRRTRAAGVAAQATPGNFRTMLRCHARPGVVASVAYISRTTGSTFARIRPLPPEAP